VREGDWIALNCDAGTLDLEISEQELAQRMEALADKQPEPVKSGYQQLYIDRVLQADEGCDFDFLVGCRGADVPKHSL
jgi:L-arabonate dehydrase